jgi:hypothetical protein
MLTLAFDVQFVTAASPILNQNPDVPLVYVIVNASIYDDVKFYINRYQSDVAKIGFNTTVLSFSGDNPEDVRAILVNASLEGLVGCLLVGDIPWALYEDWEVDDEVYPIDLFYMDLDGIWTDTDNNGKYDQHTGDRVPEIWVGRIKVPDMAKSEEVSLIQNYFDKNHNYRTGVLSLPDRALIYIDDDWTEFGDSMDSAIAFIYDNRTLVNENTTTCATDYLERLSQNWSLVHLITHGNVGFHEFKLNDEGSSFAISEDIRLTDPHAFFYNLVSCHVANYEAYDYIGAWYIFSRTYGVAAIGPTDAGGMWCFSGFYSNFKNHTLGFSFRTWLAERMAEEDEGHWYDWTWYYGMTILGDPTLSAKPEVENIDVAITNISPYRTILSNSTSTSINVTAENQGDTIETFDVTLYYNSTQIGIQTVTLTSEKSRTLTFEWTTPIPLGNYTITAEASQIPGETETEDNTVTYSLIQISIPGDINADRIVDIIDIAIVARAYETRPEGLKWDANADINEDGEINIIDIALVAREYGKTA